MMSVIFLAFIFSQPLYEVEEIVVTATRYPTALKNVALATVVIEKQEIDKLKPLGLGEILQTYAGVAIKDYGSPGSVSSIFIRGIPANGTLILLDNHPLNSITTGMADLNAINMSTIERIEIIKGPVSSLYGANGLGGAINIITTKTYEKPEFALSLTSSTTEFNQPLQSQEIFMNAGAPFGNTSLDISGAYSSSDGFRSNSDVEHYHFRSNLLHNMENLHINAGLTYDDKEYGIPGPMPLVDSMHPVPQFGDSTATSLFDRERDRIIIGDLTFTWGISDRTKWQNTLFADRKSIQFRTTYPGWLGDTITEDFDYLVHTLGLNSLAGIDIDDTEFIIGIDAHYDTLQTTKSSGQTGDTVWNASSYSLGGWLEFRKRFGDISIIPRIRFDRNSQFGNFLSPGIGIVSSPAPNLWMKVSMGKAFRAPTFNDLYFPLSGNQDLKPEHGWAYELRLESSLSPTLFAALSLFMRRVEDRIFWLPKEDRLWQPQNVNHLSIRGLDIEIHSTINDITDFYLEGTYLHSRQRNNEIVYDFYDWVADTGLTIVEEKERDAAFTPKYSISSKITINLPNEFAIHINGSFSAERINYYPNYDNYPNVIIAGKTLESYFIINGNVSKRLISPLTGSFGVKNILDISYATQFGYTLDDLDYPMPGRVFFIKLMWQHK